MKPHEVLGPEWAHAKVANVTLESDPILLIRKATDAISEAYDEGYRTGSSQGRYNAYHEIFLKLRKDLGTLEFNKWCRESIEESDNPLALRG